MKTRDGEGLPGGTGSARSLLPDVRPVGVDSAEHYLVRWESSTLCSIPDERHQSRRHADGEQVDVNAGDVKSDGAAGLTNGILGHAGVRPAVPRL